MDRFESPGDAVGDERSTAARAGAALASSNGQKPEFWTLFEESRPRLRLIAAAVLSTQGDADDALHDAAIIGLARFTQFQPGTSFLAWMAQITRLTALNSLRKRRRRSRLAALLPTRRPADTSDGAPVDPELDAALATLEETARICLVLRVVGGMSYASIAQALQLPEGTAMSHVHRARRQLHTRLAPAHSGLPSSTRKGRS